MVNVRILYIINGNGLVPQYGGSVVRSANIAKRIALMGHSVEILTTIGGKIACRQLGCDVQFHVVPASFLFRVEKHLWQRALGYVISTIFACMYVYRLKRPDIVYSDSDLPCDVVPAALFQRLKKARWVAMIHHIVQAEQGSTRAGVLANMKQRIQAWAHHLIVRYAATTFLYDSEAGRAVAKELKRYGLRTKNVRFVNNGVDIDRVYRLPPLATQFDACLIGHLRPGKGLWEIAPIWKSVLARRGGARLAIAGYMPPREMTAFRKELESQGLADYIDLLGQLSHDAAIGLIKSSTLMIMPSLEEGWGIAICEALAAGRPVVGYDLPAYRSLFGEAVVRVPLQDKIEFSKAVVALLANPEKRAEISIVGRLVADNFDWSKAADRDARYFRELIDSKTT